jgi:hypothetical protein
MILLVARKLALFRRSRLCFVRCLDGCAWRDKLACIESWLRCSPLGTLELYWCCARLSGVLIMRMIGKKMPPSQPISLVVFITPPGSPCLEDVNSAGRVRDQCGFANCAHHSSIIYHTMSCYSTGYLPLAQVAFQHPHTRLEHPTIPISPPRLSQ